MIFDDDDVVSEDEREFFCVWNNFLQEKNMILIFCKTDILIYHCKKIKSDWL